MKGLRFKKTGSLFQNIFLILCLLLVCMLAYMTFFMDRYVFRAQVRELDASYLRMLEQSSESISRTVGDLEQQVQLFLSDQSLLQYLLSPQSKGTEEGMQILRSLKDYVSLTPSVEQLWLYSPVSGTVLSSDGYLSPRQGSQARPLLEQYEKQNIPRSGPDFRRSAMVCDGHLYILIDFVPAEWLGCFIFQIDPQRLGVELGEGQPHILIVDAGGRLLLDGAELTGQSVQIDMTQTGLFYADPSAQRGGRQQYYQAVNDKLDWQLLMEIQERPGLYDRSAFWFMVLPFLAVMLVLGAGGAYLITKKIYAPINRLLALVMERSGQPLPPGSDTDYLHAAYQQTIQDNAQLRAQFSALGRDVCQYLCREAVSGQLASPADLEGMAGFLPDGLFQAALVQLGKSNVALQSPIKHKFQLSALQALALQLPECLCCLEWERDCLILVLLFPLKQQPTQGAELMERFIAQAAQQTQCRLVYGLGESCAGLHELKTSFDQAVHDLQYNAYLSNDSDPAQAHESLSNFCGQELNLTGTVTGKKKYHYVEEAKKFIQENYMDCSLSANDVSAHVGISPSYFSSLFNELLQESFSSYLNQIRVEKAKEMLAVTDIPVKEIGFRCGFNSANVFGRVFKKYTGQSPKQFRDSKGRGGGER